jgi:hypothetical protein
MKEEWKMSNIKPSYTAYSVTKRGDGKDDWWSEIGSSFEHADGRGQNLILHAIPVSGKIVLRVPKERKEDAPPPRENGNRRHENSSRGRK